MILLAVDFPLSLPTGDLSTRFKGASERKKGAEGGERAVEESV
jgi:hypothetical protein